MVAAPPSSLLTFLMLALVCACAAPEMPEGERLEPVTEAISFDPNAAFHYPVGPGDVLRIIVYRHPELSSPPYKENMLGTPVDPTGKLSMPLVGVIEAQGRSVWEIRDIITARLGEFLRDPIVDVVLLEAKSHQIFVLGEVARPGMILLDRPTSAVESIGLAGGMTDTAERGSVAVIRGSLEDPQVLLFDATTITLEGRFPLQAGDIVFVTERSFASTARATRDLIPILQAISLPISTARDVVWIDQLRNN
jgi:polysaccharide biosynthesis/export protein